MSETTSLPTAERVDVMLLLEGTFPYVSGGVSSWVNQVIRGFPELTFGAVFLGSRADDYGDMRYELPDNFVHLQVHHMHDASPPPAVASAKGKPAAFKFNRELHDALRASREDENALEATAKAGKLLKDIIPMLGSGGALSEEAFMYSELSWDYITENYRTFCTDPSFVDYFWTVRIMHSPIWMLMDIAENLIPADCYHTISTGYAGFLGALLKHKTGKPLILSEHGIYTKERKIDLFQSTWIRDNRGMFEKDPSQLGYFRNMWLRFFEAMGRMCYDASDTIVALYENNRLRQIADGAPPERTMNVANGINLPRLAALRDKREYGPNGEPPPTLCLIGRVVPIKDIKTFVRCMKTVCDEIPEAEAWIAGPEDEDPAYALECRSIAISLGLEDRVKFLGFQKIDELLPTVGIGVLSSISEALPLVLLEGFAAGVPAVATDVGSCAQLIFGLDDEDKALGASGDVVRIADPEALGLAIARLLKDPEKWHAAQKAGIERVEKYYTQDMMFAKYRAIYDESLQAGRAVGNTKSKKRRFSLKSLCPHVPGLALAKGQKPNAVPADPAPEQVNASPGTIETSEASKATREVNEAKVPFKDEVDTALSDITVEQQLARREAQLRAEEKAIADQVNALSSEAEKLASALDKAILAQVAVASSADRLPGLSNAAQPPELPRHAPGHTTQLKSTLFVGPEMPDAQVCPGVGLGEDKYLSNTDSKQDDVKPVDDQQKERG